MREKYLWLAISVLTALTLGQACYIYEEKAGATELYEQPPVQPEIHLKGHAEKAFDAQQEEFEKWRRRVREQIDQGYQLLDRDFDLFFGDGFFAGRAEPFAEMERVRRRVAGEFRDQERTLFDGYWEKWFEQRLKMGPFRTEIVRTSREVTMIIHVPGLAAKTADISVTDERIRLTFSAKTVAEEKRAGGLIKKGSVQTYIKLMPVPDDAAGGTGKVEIDGERVTIRFERKKSH
ncbi:MAG: hypothetical protein HY550_04085 [Elusimicrobia bacterium]|nr:hypothetical protein [Elusimicrobiota bacterium]